MGLGRSVEDGEEMEKCLSSHKNLRPDSHRKIARTCSKIVRCHVVDVVFVDRFVIVPMLDHTETCLHSSCVERGPLCSSPQPLDDRPPALSV